MYNIAKYPEVQEKCFKELREVFGDDKNTPTTLSHLNNLSYLELVVKETLRIFPSVPFIGRKANEEIELSKCALDYPWPYYNFHKISHFSLLQQIIESFQRVQILSCQFIVWDTVQIYLMNPKSLYRNDF